MIIEYSRDEFGKPKAVVIRLPSYAMVFTVKDVKKRSWLEVRRQILDNVRNLYEMALDEAVGNMLREYK